jgi:organic radical activating enzyme
VKVTGASFLLTFKCTAKCRHCSYRGGPDRVNDHIALADAKRWLTELVETQPFDWLTIHGGEPFLYFDILKQIIHKAAELEVPKIGIITNAYWAKEQKETEELLKELMDAGLNRITVSIDAFHQEFIPVERANTAVIAATNLGIEKVWVDSYFINPTELYNPYDQKTQSLIENLRDTNGVEFSKYMVDMEGRAADFLVGEKELSDNIPYGTCQFPFWLGGDLKNPKVIEIDREGNVTLCPGLCIGNAKEVSLSQILDSYDYRKHLIIHILANEGPIGLHNHAKSLGLQVAESFVDKCHLCYEIRRLLNSTYPKYLAHRGCYHTNSR